MSTVAAASSPPARPSFGDQARQRARPRGGPWHDGRGFPPQRPGRGAGDRRSRAERGCPCPEGCRSHPSGRRPEHQSRHPAALRAAGGSGASRPAEGGGSPGVLEEGRAAKALIASAIRADDTRRLRRHPPGNPGGLGERRGRRRGERRSHAARGHAPGRARDRIAWNYAHNFGDVFGLALPRLLALRRAGWPEPGGERHLHGAAGRHPRQPRRAQIRSRGGRGPARPGPPAGQALLAAADPALLTAPLLALDGALKAEGLNPGTTRRPRRRLRLRGAAERAPAADGAPLSHGRHC